MNTVLKRTVSLITLTSFLWWNLALAAPDGGQVVAGSAEISQAGNTTTINQASQNAVINWNNFNTSAAEAVQFNQPNTSSIALNRVTSGMPTTFAGLLTANGHVWIVNPAGVLFTSTSRIDVAGLMATTLNITDQNFMAKNYQFNTVPGFEGSKIINNGLISAKDSGVVVLVAPGVENNGIIQANLGQVVLASGSAFILDLYGDQLINFGTSAPVQNGYVSNSGTIQATGGKVLITAHSAGQLLDNVISMNGVIEANTASTGKHGEIILNGGDQGKVVVKGILRAKSGGFIETSGSQLDVSQATIDAGVGGTWLIDPTDITIDGPFATTIEGQLNGGTSVLVTTSSGGGDTGNITVAASITAITAAGGDLTLTADNFIIFLTGNSIITDGSQTYNALQMNMDATTLTSNSGAITLNTPVVVSGTNTITTNVLLINDAVSGTGDLTLNSPLIDISAPSSPFSVTANNLTINGTTVLLTFGAISAADTLTINGNVIGNGNSLNLQSGTKTILGNDSSQSVTGVNVLGLFNTFDVYMGTISATVVSLDASAIINIQSPNVTFSSAAQGYVMGTINGLGNNVTFAGNNIDLLGDFFFTNTGTGISTLQSTCCTIQGNNLNLTFTGGVAQILGAGQSLSGVNNLTVNAPLTTNVNYQANTSLNFNGNVTQTGDVTLNAPAITMPTTWDANNNSLSISGPSTFSLTNAITNLNNFTLNIATTIDTTSFSVGGTLTFNNPVTLDNDVALTGNSIVFSNTIDGDGVTPRSLMLTGNSTFTFDIGGTNPLSTLTVNGNTSIEGGLSINATTSTFNGTIGSSNNSGLNIVGNVAFNGEVGEGGLPLNSLSISGQAVINTDKITTTQVQNYGGAVLLKQSATLQASFPDVFGISFSSTIDNFAGTGPWNLTMQTPSTSFSGNIGTVNGALGTVTVTESPLNTGDKNAYLFGAANTFNVAAINFGGFLLDPAQTHNLVISGAATFGDIVGGVNPMIGGLASPLASLTVNGSSTINASVIHTTGVQRYNGGATIPAVMNFDTNGNTLTFGGNVAASTYDLNFASNLIFNGITGNTKTFNSITAGGVTQLNGGTISTAGAQAYNAAVTVGGDTIVNAGTTVDFASTIDGPNALSVSGSTITLNANVGDTQALSNFSLAGSTQITLNNISSIKANGTTGTLFNGVVAGAGNDVVITGKAEFSGGTATFDSLDITGTSIIGSDITTTGIQNYQGAAIVNANINLTGSTVKFLSTLSGNGFTPNLTITGNAEFHDNVGVGFSAALALLDISGNTVVNKPVGSLSIAATTLAFHGFFDDAVANTSKVIISSNSTFYKDIGSIAPLKSFANFGTLTVIPATFDIFATDISLGGVSGSTAFVAHGNTSLAGTIGSVGTPLLSFRVIGSTVLDAATIDVYANTARFDAMDSGDEQFTVLTIHGNAQLGGDIGLNAALDTVHVTGATSLLVPTVDIYADNSIFDGTINNATALGLHGNAQFGGNIGGTTALTSLHVFNNTTVTGTISSIIAGTSTFDGTLNGARPIAITGNAQFGGIVGGTTPLTNLTVSGVTTFGVGATAVNTNGIQSYSGGANLPANTILFETTGNTLTFGGTVSGASNNLQAAADTPLVFTGTGTRTLNSLTAANTTAINGGNITTTSTQNYGGAVTLGAAAAINLTASSVNFSNTLDGAADLQITGNAVFNTNVGDTIALNSLAVTGNADFPALAVVTDVKTTLTQSYGGAVRFVNTLFSGTTTTFSGTVNAMPAINGILTVNGNAAFNGVVGATSNIVSLSVTGNTQVNTNITTSASQSYTGPVSILGDDTLTGDQLFFSNGLLNSGVPHNLTLFGGNNGVNISGDVGALGNNFNTVSIGGFGTALILTSPTVDIYATTTTLGKALGDNILTVHGDIVWTPSDSGNNPTSIGAVDIQGKTTFQGTSPGVITSGSQSYEDAVTLKNSVGLSGTFINFSSASSTVDSFSTTPFDLTIIGDATFTGLVGSIHPLLELSVSGGASLFENITAIASQSYGGVVTLNNNITLTSSSILFQNKVQQSGGARSLVTTGTTEFRDDVGTLGSVLSSLSVGSDTRFNKAGTLNVYAATQVYGGFVDGNTAHTTNLKLRGDVQFNNNVGNFNRFFELDLLGTQTTLNPATVDIYADTLDVASALDGNTSLTVHGNFRADGTTVGGVTALTLFKIIGNTELAQDLNITATTTAFTGTVDTAADSSNPRALITSGNAEFGGDIGVGNIMSDVIVNGNTTLTSPSINMMLSNNAQFGQTINGASALTITVGGQAEFGNGIGGSTALTSLHIIGNTVVHPALMDIFSGTSTFDGTLDSDNGTVVTFNGNAVFNGQVGNGGLLGELTVNGSTAINTDIINTDAIQTYQGAVTLGVATINLTGSTMTFNSSVDGATDLTITGDLVLTNTASMGATTPLNSLTVTGTTTGVNVTTVGDQTYMGAYTLTMDDVLTSTAGNINFNSTVDGGFGLTTSAAGASGTTFSGVVGTTPLTFLDVTGIANIGANISTSGTQYYHGATNLTGASRSLSTSGSTVTFDNTINGASTALTINGGTVIFNGANARTLSALTSNGATQVNGGSITSGIMNYVGPVTIGGNSVLSSGAASMTFHDVLNNSTLTSANTLALTGSIISFNADVGAGASHKFASLTTNGSTLLSGSLANIETTGTTTFNGILNTFSGNSLHVTGNALFNGAVGGIGALNLLDVSGTSQIGANITTTTTQEYHGATTLANTVNLTGSTVTFDSTIGGAQGLTITGNAVFNGVVSGLNSLSVSGTSAINTNSISSTGTQLYSGAVTLGVTPINLTGSTVTFNNNVDGPRALTITGNLVVGNATGAIGAGTPLNSLLVTGTTTGVNVTTTGDQTYTLGYTLTEDDVLTTTTGNITFQNTITGPFNLTLNSTSGNFNFNGATNISNLLGVTGTGALNVNAPITTTGAGDSIVLAGAVLNNGAGATPFTPGTGRFLIWTVNPANDTRGAMTYAFKQYNATFGVTGVLGTGNGLLYTVAPNITPGLTGAVTKPFDGNNNATLAPANYTASGMIDGDAVTLNNPVNGFYDTAAVGTGKNVSVSGIALTGASNGLVTVFGYSFPTTTANANIGTITGTPPPPPPPPIIPIVPVVVVPPDVPNILQGTTPPDENKFVLSDNSEIVDITNAEPVGIVLCLCGFETATDPLGNVRILQSGDKIYAGEKVEGFRDNQGCRPNIKALNGANPGAKPAPQAPLKP